MTENIDRYHKFIEEVVEPRKGEVFSLGDLAWQLAINHPDRDCAVTSVLRDGWAIGIADRSKKGYTPTNVYFNDEIQTTYDEVEFICNQFNEIVLELTLKEASDIVISTL